MSEAKETQRPSLTFHAFSARCQALFDDIDLFAEQVEQQHADLLDPDRVEELKEAIKAKAQQLYHQRYAELQQEADERRRLAKAAQKSEAIAG